MVLKNLRTRGALLVAVPVFALGATGLTALSLTALGLTALGTAHADEPSFTDRAAQVEGRVAELYGGKTGNDGASVAVADSVLGDWNGDTRGDIVTRDAAGKLWVYAGTGNPRSPYRVRRLIGGGWNIYTALVRHGDWNDDGRQDVLARDRAGVLWFYAGTGAASGAGHRARVRVGGGWSAYSHLVGVSDWTGDGSDDLIAVDAAGKLWIYNGRGVAPALFQARRQIGRSWNIYNMITAWGDLSEDGGAELLARYRGGALYIYGSTGDPNVPYTRAEKIEDDWRNVTAQAGVGDLNGGGLPDVVVRNAQGQLVLLSPDAPGEAPVGRGWNIYNAIF